MEKQKANCTICSKEVEIKLPGMYTDLLECGHIITKISTSSIMERHGISLVEASKISEQRKQVRELPKISGNELVTRALNTTSQTYEDFFASENPLIEDMIKENGKDNAVLIFTAIHAHFSKTLFALSRFKNLYYIQIEKLRKEIEDKAVKELIENHDFHYEDIAPKPKKIKTVGDKLDKKYKTGIDEAKTALGGLTKKDGSPIQMSDLMGLFIKNKEKEKEKSDYKEGLDKIKESISSKEN